MAKWADLGDLPQQLDLRNQLTIAKTALRFYAKAERYVREGVSDTGPSEIERDEGDVARTALRQIGAA